MTDRRQAPRIPVVLDATWNGRSGATTCRVTDISWRGCFVQSLAGPVAGDDASIVVMVGNEEIGFRGRVPYVENHMGFSMEFDVLTSAQIEAMTSVLGAPPPGPPA
jgi:hypothetical protein